MTDYAKRQATSDEVAEIDSILAAIGEAAGGHPVRLSIAALFEALSNAIAILAPDAQRVTVQSLCEGLRHRFPAGRAN